MKNIKISVVIIFLSLLLVSCKSDSYETFNDKHVNVETAFKKNHEEYYLYFYSFKCINCDNVKDLVFKQAKNKNRPLYFINNKDVLGVLNMTDDRDYNNYGATNFLELKIYGFPTLLLIRNGRVISQFVGANLITKELSNIK